uniref:Heparinase II/III-like C-terminal domain-containing protein n=1 Tax=OCS116 cluster bacterium TaxID=2030921 RepID=A0A2A4Z3U1_9PROT
MLSLGYYHSRLCGANMTYFSFSEKIKLVYLAFTYYIRHIKQNITLFHILRWRKAKSLPNAVIHQPDDFHISDPTIAEDIYDGHISLAGLSFNIGANSPFSVIPPNQDWYDELISFGWLRHFKALESPIALLQAKALFIDWLYNQYFHSRTNWRASVTAKRLIALLSYHSILIDEGGEISSHTYFKTIDQHIQILIRTYKNAKHSQDKLDVAIALCFAQNCLDKAYSDRYIDNHFEAMLATQLNEQILPDGGHISRNPDTLLEIMLDLIPLKTSYTAQKLPVPVALQNAIDRIIPVLHFLCHPDGNFIQFNGAGPTDWAAFLSVFDAEGEGFNPPTQAPHSGYYRLYAPNLQVTIDAGAMPEAQFSTNAHAGPLAIEIFISGYRMVVNCGAAPKYDYNWFTTTRSTAAHSTLCVDNESTAIIKLPNWLSNLIGNQIFHGHTKMPVTIGKTTSGPQVTASHNGYVRAFGLIHKRQITLSEDGDLITGLDDLEPATPNAKPSEHKIPFDIRFHLHPDVMTQSSRDGHSILITLPNQETWQFVSTFASFRLEDSIYLGEGHEKKKTSQIVISGEVEDYAEVKWQFRKI